MKGPPMPCRFWSKALIGDDCWEWQASLHPGGYGRFKYRNVMVKSHRLAWELYYGSDPGDLCVCHTCDNRRCVRPDHLFLGTHQDNNRDRDSKGRNGGTAEANRLKTACIRGHPFDERNIYRHGGARRCRICQIAAVTRYKRRRREKAS